MTRLSRPGAAEWSGLLSLTAIWGSSFAVTALAVDSIAPVWVVALRMAIGGMILLAIAVMRRERLTLDMRHILWYVALAFVGALAPFYLISWGMQRIESSIAGIIMAMVPLFAVLFAHLFLGDEKLTRRRTFGFVVGFCGLIVVIGPVSPGGSGLSASGFFAGDFPPELALLAATFCYAGHGVMARRAPPISALQIALGEIGIGALIALPLALLMAPDGLSASTTTSVIAAVSLGIFPTAVAGLVLFWLLQRVGVGFVAYCNYLIPLFAAGLGVIAFGEVLGPGVLVGMVIILAGIAICETRRGPRGQSPSPD